MTQAQLNLTDTNLTLPLTGNETEYSTQTAASVTASYEDDTLQVHAFIAGLVICITGLLLNIIAVFILLSWKKRSMRQQMILLVNIIICDILIALAGVVFFSLRLHQFYNIGNDTETLAFMDQQIRHKITCYQRIVLRFWDVGTNANLFGLFLMSLDHFIAIKFSLKHSVIMRRRILILMIIASWIVSAIVAFLDQVLISANSVLKELDEIYGRYFKHIHGYCLRESFYTAKTLGIYQWDIGQQRDLVIKVAVDVSLIALVCVSMICIYSYIARIVVKITRSKRLRLQNTPNNTIENLRKVEKSKYKGICTSVILLVTFVLIWMPYVITRLKMTISPGPYDRTAFLVTLVMCCCTTLLDIVIYFFRSKEVHHLLRDLTFRSSCCKSDFQVDPHSIVTPSTKRTSIPSL